MPGKYVVSLTHGLDNTDKATVAFVVANAAVASDKETVVFLSIEARAVAKGYRRSVHEEGFAPLKELMDNFAKAGGRCSSAHRVSRSASSMKTIWWRALRWSAARSWSNS